jgi:hypothetical protein
MKKLYLVWFVVISLLSSPLFADVTVQTVKGTVGVMEAKKLTPVTAGMKLKDDAMVVTGANSEVTMQVNNGMITLKSLTTARLSGVKVTPTSSTAAVALRGGTVVSEVKQITGLKTSFTVTTPVGTSSVRGTTHTISYSPGRGMQVAVASGVVAVASNRGAVKPVAAGSSYVQAAASAAPPQMISQAAAEVVVTGAATAFAPVEETAAAADLGGQSAALTELVTLIDNASTSGRVNLNITFP